MCQPVYQTSGSDLCSAGVLILATKALQTRKALMGLSQTKFGTAFSVQNGVLKDEILGDVFGSQSVLGAVADISGEMRKNGNVVFSRYVNLLIGEFRRSSEHSGREQATAIDAAGLRAVATSHIQSLAWSKFVGWIGLAALSLTTRANTWQYLSDPKSARVLVPLIREMGELARVCEIELTDQAVVPVASVCQ
jgi:2-dehydropantoate 2-reductase